MTSTFWQQTASVLRAVVAAVFTMALVGCAALIPDAATHDEPVLDYVRVDAERREVPPDIAAVAERPTDLWRRIARGLSWEHDSPLIATERDRFLAQPRLFDVLSERAQPGLGWIVAEIEARGLPMELALVPIIESMLDPWAYSSQRAAGLWQISPATAEHYGLERNWWYDARLDIPTATDFALSYLVELYEKFDQDWQLALAAYNSGPGRVARARERALRRGLSTDYWSLELPRETRRYLPRLLALSDLLRQPEAYALRLPNIAADHGVIAVDTGGQIELTRVAQLAGIEAGDVQRLNPAHLRWATAPQQGQQLWLPVHAVTAFEQGLAALPDEKRVEWAHYRVAPGDSLIAIAKRFDTQVQLIQSVNGIKGSFIRAGDELMIPGGGDWRDSLQVASRDWPPKRSPRRHRVRSGESLWTIARRYNVGVDTLTRLNKIDPDSYIQPGQTLRISP